MKFQPTIGLIAEVKLKSPFGFKSEYSFNYLFNIANIYGDWISIHTDLRWGGSFETLLYARSLTDKMILAKGIHSKDKDIEKALVNGANKVLVVGRIPDKSLLPYCWLEPLSFSKPPKYRGVPIIVNRRNLKTGLFRKIGNLPVYNTYIAASFIKTFKDIPFWADGWIVGENLVSFTKNL